MNRKWIAIALLLTATAALAGNPDRVPAGYDNWITIGGGATFMSFADEPIPADFFCAGSDSFTGRLNFEGVPLATDPPGKLGLVDTVVERLDDAVFSDGEAMSRLRVKAMHLATRDHFENACGIWAVRAGLAEQQPTTTILYRQLDDFAGTFDAEIVINVQLTFTNIDDPDDVRVIQRTVHFAELLQAPYSFSPIAEDRDTPGRVMGKRSAATREVMVDTDADGLPDSALKAINDKDDWHYHQGYACPVGVWPPNKQCIVYAEVHDAPDHAHVTIPDAPCDKAVSGQALFETRLTVQQQIDPVQTKPCQQQVYDNVVTALREQFTRMEEAGRLVIPADQLLDEVVRKIEDR